ncbi:uncharacterized protein JCM6883_003202 [Sporobolomyces salmoneus]|uniref:uncharacterized protein n=1 Tax=Sporobolomyces salmoneus TaxID=183962 RepID=UPI003181CF36
MQEEEEFDSSDAELDEQLQAAYGLLVETPQEPSDYTTSPTGKSPEPFSSTDVVERASSIGGETDDEGWEFDTGDLVWQETVDPGVLEGDESTSMDLDETSQSESTTPNEAQVLTSTSVATDPSATTSNVPSASESIEQPAQPPKKTLAEKKEEALERRRRKEEERERQKQEERRQEQEKLGSEELAKYGLGRSRRAPQHQPSETSNTINLEVLPQITHTEEQRDILKLVDEGKNVFITGSAGVGKSIILSEVKKLLRAKFPNVKPEKGKQEVERVVMTAPTGSAAINVEGVTIHSWAGLETGRESVAVLYDKISSQERKRRTWRETEVLIIDEISMLHPTFLFRLNVLAKLLRTNPRPFGGMQLIVCGDFFQLPPVGLGNPHEIPCVSCGGTLLYEINKPSKTGASETESSKSWVCRDRMNENRGVLEKGCGLEFPIHTYAFETEDWAECKFEIRELTKVFRQSDVEFIKVLNKVRRAEHDQADLDFFKSCGSALRFNNGKIKPTKLLPTKEKVDAVNRFEFEPLPGPIIRFEARDDASGYYARQRMDARLKAYAKYPQALKAKVGAQVILLVTLSLKEKLVNGSRGVIVDFVPAPTEKEILESVPNQSSDEEEVEQRKRMIGTAEWKAQALIEFYKRQTHNLVPRVYFPSPRDYEPGRIITINAQHFIRSLGPTQGAVARTGLGQSLDAVAVDLGKCFAPGQAYVALSRARTAEGLVVESIPNHCITASPIVKKFYQAIETKVPFSHPPNPPANPLHYLTLSARRAVNLEEVFAIRKSPTSSTSTPPAEPVSVSTSSTLPEASSESHVSLNYKDQLFEAAQTYFNAQKNLGASGGIGIVDENGFVEAAKFAFSLVQRGKKLPTRINGAKRSGLIESEPSRQPSNQRSPTKRIRTSSAVEEVVTQRTNEIESIDNIEEEGISGATMEARSRGCD